MPRLRALGLIVLAACGEHGDPSSTDAAPGAVDAEPEADAPLVAIDAARGTLVATPPSLDFGSIPINATTQLLTVAFEYHGQGAPFEAITITGPNAGEFALQGTTCSWRGDICTLRVRFTPVAVGVRTADLVVSINDATATVALRGTGTPQASLRVIPTLHDYGAIGVGTSASWTFTVTNETGGITGALSTSITGANSTEFTRATDACTGAVLSANASCTVVVAFSPNTAATKAATLAVSGSPGGGVTASLLGSGSSGNALVISPTTFDFGTVSQGNSSLGKMFTVTNNGTATTGLIATMMAGTHPGDFLKQADQCNNRMLGPGSSCTLFVTFEPGPTGARNARVQAAASPGGFAAADLSGTCTP